MKKISFVLLIVFALILPLVIPVQVEAKTTKKVSVAKVIKKKHIAKKKTKVKTLTTAGVQNIGQNKKLKPGQEWRVLGKLPPAKDKIRQQKEAEEEARELELLAQITATK